MRLQVPLFFNTRVNAVGLHVSNGVTGVYTGCVPGGVYQGVPTQGGIYREAYTTRIPTREAYREVYTT